MRSRQPILSLQVVFDFINSLRGRLTAILVLGMSLSAVAALLASELGRHADFEHIRQEHVLASAVDVISRLQGDTARTVKSLDTDQLVGANLMKAPTGAIPSGESFTQALVARVGGSLQPSLVSVPSKYCIQDDPFWHRPRAAGIKDVILPPDCWLLSVTTASGRMNIGLSLPFAPAPPSAVTSPWFLSLVILGSLALALLTARLASAPMQRLTDAADAFANSIDAPPVAETGPSDVRAALTTFNLMQERVREGVRERTRILAAISHDLQTPLTRLRLRLEQVEDEPLRTRLIGDLSATMGMVKRGLDLARSGESAEDWMVVNLNSLLSSLADDATDSGQAVTFADGQPFRVHVRPDALKRCLMNLIDNAIKYGGGAEISCVAVGNQVVVHVRDRGPGISDELLARVFEPFVRGASAKSSGDGTGIGLTIARAQAAAINGVLGLANHPEGGLLATLTLTAHSRRDKAA